MAARASFEPRRGDALLPARSTAADVILKVAKLLAGV